MLQNTAQNINLASLTFWSNNWGVLYLSASSDKSYTEAVRGCYAFDINQINMKQEYAPYVMGYGEKNMVLLLKKVGFKSVEVKAPLTHGQRS